MALKTIEQHNQEIITSSLQEQPWVPSGIECPNCPTIEMLEHPTAPRYIKDPAMKKVWCPECGHASLVLA